MIQDMLDSNYIGGIRRRRTDAAHYSDENMLFHSERARVKRDAEDAPPGYGDFPQTAERKGE